MLYTGIVSVTFRNLTPAEIISLVSETGMEAIEWGGDVHVPHGDLEQARRVRNLTKEGGLRVASYGSYFKVGCDSNFHEILETAIELGAPSIRIWAGNRSSTEADEEWRDKVVKETKRISGLSRQRRIRLSFEYHDDTLVDSLESAKRFMLALNDDGVSLYWQPQLDKNSVENMLVLTSLSPWLSNVHVFHYVNNQQLSLHEGRQDWIQYLGALPAVPDRFVMLEFVKNGEREQFFQDAETLKSLVQQDQTRRRNLHNE